MFHKERNVQLQAVQALDSNHQYQYLSRSKKEALAFVQRVNVNREQLLDSMPQLVGEHRHATAWARKHGITEELLHTWLPISFLENMRPLSPRLREIIKSQTIQGDRGDDEVQLGSFLGSMQFEMDEQRELAKVEQLYNESTKLLLRYFPELVPQEPTKLFLFYNENEFPQEGGSNASAEVTAMHLGRLDGTYYIGIKTGDFYPSEFARNPYRRKNISKKEEQEKIIRLVLHLLHERVHQRQAELQTEDFHLSETSIQTILSGLDYGGWSPNRIGREYLSRYRRIVEDFSAGEKSKDGLLARATEEALAIVVEQAAAFGEMKRLSPSDEAIAYYDKLSGDNRMYALANAHRNDTYMQNIVFDDTSKGVEVPVVPMMGQPYLIGLFDIVPKLYPNDSHETEKVVTLLSSLDLVKLSEVEYDSAEWKKILDNPQQGLQRYLLSS